MPRGLVRYLLFFLAYIPIYVIAALKTIDRHIYDTAGNIISYDAIFEKNLIPILLVSFTLFLIFYFLLYSRLAMHPRGNPVFQIRKIDLQHKEYVTYLGTYILPFIGLESKDIFDLISIVFMFLTIGFIFSKTNLIYTNPTLVLFGYDIYEIEDTNGNIYDCISRQKLSVGDRPKGVKLGEKTFIISK
jgi:hypothetical protein